MEQYITDTIFRHIVTEKTIRVELEEKRIYEKLLEFLSSTEYVRIEEELNAYYDLLSREMFYRGFIEGIRFILEAALDGRTTG